jgi:homoserine dehydrogenase
MELKLAFVGFGNVARAFARILDGRRARLAEEFDLTWETTAIATRSHGCVLSQSGIDLKSAVSMVDRNEPLSNLPGVSIAGDSMEVIQACEAAILFETTTLDPLNGEPAATHIRNALGRGINVITANKGPIAFAFRELRGLARDNDVKLRFEGTVMDGAPVFNLAEYCLPAARVLGFHGVLNSTTNIILSGMESGRSFDDSLAEAVGLGIAEANADYDIEGWDAAVKAVVLANVLMNANARPSEVERYGILDITSEDLKSAAAAGNAVRLIARADRLRGGLKLSVGPELVPLASPLAGARGASNVLVIKTDLMGEIAIIETDPGVEQTAYALLSDLLRIHEEMVS